MKKLFLLKSLLLLCALVAGSSSVWGQETTVATFDSDAVVDNSAYASDYGGNDWTINMAGNNRSIGFNNKNCVTIGDALGTSANKDNYGIVVKSKNKFANVNKITFKYTGGSGDGGKLYLAYSTNNTTWNAISLDTGSGLSAQGVTPSQNTTFTFEFSTIASAYYAFILDKGNTSVSAYRFDYVTVNFISVTSSSSSAEKPTFSPVAGELSKAQNITISSTGAAKIIYTTNGDEPTLDGSTTTTVDAATASVLVNEDMTIKAKGIDSSNEPSTMATAAYTINIAEPAILPADLNYATSVDISFTQADDIDVYYTLNGTDPTTNGTKYNGTPFAISENLTIKAIAIDEYGNKSDVVEAKYKNTDLQPTEITIDNWNTLFGTNFNGSVTGNDKKDFSGTIDGVTVTYAEATNMYIKDDDLRIYTGSSLSFTAPTGYAIYEIAFEGTTSSDKAPVANVGTFNYSTKKWTGLASSVTLSRNDGNNGYTKFTSATIKLTNKAAISISSYGWSTFNSNAPLDFSGTGVTAYIVTGHNNGKTLIKEPVTTVAAGTPLLLNAAAGDYEIPVVATGTTYTDNKLQPGNGTEVAAVSGKTRYVLALNGSALSFMKIVSTPATVPTGKAYLEFDGEIPAPVFGFGDATAIEAATKSQHTETVVYNLNGQRVAQPTKGLYIVNGKKVVVK